MRAARIAMPNGERSWTVLDVEGDVVDSIRQWIIHLEETNASPNTTTAYLRHVVDFANYLGVNDANLHHPTVALYDRFLAWRGSSRKGDLPSPKLIQLKTDGTEKLSPSTRNQIHLAIKSFYRFLFGSDGFEIATREVHKAYDGHRTRKGFLEHINTRRHVRKKDRYSSGDLGKVRKRVLAKRLNPEEVLKLIEASRLIRDAFLIVLLYNTGMRIGEALGLRIGDIDLSEKVIWIIPRDDNTNSARVKSRQTRGVPVHDYVLNMYVDYLTSKEYEPAFEGGSEYVFANVKKGRLGDAMSLSYVQKLKSLLIKRTNISFHWHMFRHSHASEAIADGYSLLEVADRLGHVDPQTTAQFYQHLFSSEIRKLYLTGPEKVQERLEQLRDAELVGKDIRWA